MRAYQPLYLSLARGFLLLNLHPSLSNIRKSMIVLRLQLFSKSCVTRDGVRSASITFDTKLYLLIEITWDSWYGWQICRRLSGLYHYSFLSLVTDIVGLLVPHIFCCYQLKSKGHGLHFWFKSFLWCLPAKLPMLISYFTPKLYQFATVVKSQWGKIWACHGDLKEINERTGTYVVERMSLLLFQAVAV